VNNNQAFATSLMANLNPVVIASVVNANGPFLSNLLANLSPSVLAGAINVNGAFLTNLISNLNASVLADAINANGTFLTNLLGNLDATVLAAVMTSPQGLGLITNLLRNIGANDAQGQALVAALNAVDTGNQSTNFWSQFNLHLIGYMNVLGIPILEDIHAVIEYFEWDSAGWP
jgi:ABC-type transporter Mla subunit MlaD